MTLSLQKGLESAFRNVIYYETYQYDRRRIYFTNNTGVSVELPPTIRSGPSVDLTG